MIHPTTLANENLHGTVRARACARSERGSKVREKGSTLSLSLSLSSPNFLVFGFWFFFFCSTVQVQYFVFFSWSDHHCQYLYAATVVNLSFDSQVMFRSEAAVSFGYSTRVLYIQYEHCTHSNERTV